MFVGSNLVLEKRFFLFIEKSPVFSISARLKRSACSEVPFEFFSSATFFQENIFGNNFRKNFPQKFGLFQLGNPFFISLWFSWVKV